MKYYKRKDYNEMFEKVTKYIKDKEVLDVGCTTANVEEERRNTWVHGFLLEHAKSVMGFDILKENVKKLQEEGYNVVCANAETFELNRKFDVIFAGDIIEHLSNAGLFLDQCKKHLKKDGKLIVNTPNSFSVYNLFKNAFLLRANPHTNHEHICYYTPRTIGELISRHGFRIEKYEFSDICGTLLGKIRFYLFTLFGDRFKRKMIVIAKLDDGSVGCGKLDEGFKSICGKDKICESCRRKSK